MDLLWPALPDRDSPRSMTGLLSWLETLCRLHGVAGYEDDVIRYISAEMSAFTSGVRVDALGSVISTFRGTCSDLPRIMLFAHMDEVGFMVRRALPDGSLRLLGVSGQVRAIPGQELQIRTLQGQLLPAVVGLKSAHLSSEQERALELENLQVFPVRGEDGPEVQVGSTVSFRPVFHRIDADLVCGKALDDRAGCAILLELARRLALSPPPCDVLLVGTVQEEISCLGANAPALAGAVDLAVAIDGTVAYDTPDTEVLGDVRLGAGPVITRMLRTPGLNGWTPHPGLARLIEELGVQAHIPTQRDAVRGLMSDALGLRLLGIPSAVLGIPMRHKHSPAEMISLSDLTRTADLAESLVRHASQGLDLRRG